MAQYRHLYILLSEINGRHSAGKKFHSLAEQGKKPLT